MWRGACVDHADRYRLVCVQFAREICIGLECAVAQVEPMNRIKRVRLCQCVVFALDESLDRGRISGINNPKSSLLCVCAGDGRSTGEFTRRFQPGDGRPSSGEQEACRPAVRVMLNHVRLSKALL